MTNLNQNTLIDIAAEAHHEMATGAWTGLDQKQHNAYIWHLFIDHGVVSDGMVITTKVQKQLALFDVPLFDLLCCSQDKEQVRLGMNKTVGQAGRKSGGIRHGDYQMALRNLGANVGHERLLAYAAALTIRHAVSQDLRGLNRWITKGHGLLAYDERGIGDIGKNTYKDFNELIWSVDTSSHIHDIFMEQASVKQLQVMTDGELLACCGDDLSEFMMDERLKTQVAVLHTIAGGK